MPLVGCKVDVTVLHVVIMTSSLNVHQGKSIRFWRLLVSHIKSLPILFSGMMDGKKSSVFTDAEVQFSSNFQNFGYGMSCMMGVDEAGRGPVLGPMVFACAVSLVSKDDDLRSIGRFHISSFEKKTTSFKSSSLHCNTLL